VWVVALAIDYLGPVVIGVGRGWRVAPEHFAERHGLIILIALGESIIAIGVGAGFELGTGVIVTAALGIVVVAALWWLYFDVAAIFARRRLMQATDLELHRLTPAVGRPGRPHRSRTTHRPQGTGCGARRPRGRAADRTRA
jgi:low temperature requirement protein LtrA